MARFTQYMGLSDEAKVFLSDAKLVSKFKGSKGIASEPVHFSIYEKNNLSFIEITQTVIWSSGPMIFTCLLNAFTGEKQYEWPTEQLN